MSNRVDKNARNVYFRDAKLWDRIEKHAEKEDRSVNFIIERVLSKVFTNKRKPHAVQS